MPAVAIPRRRGGAFSIVSPSIIEYAPLLTPTIRAVLPALSPPRVVIVTRWLFSADAAAPVDIIAPLFVGVVAVPPRTFVEPLPSVRANPSKVCHSCTVVAQIPVTIGVSLDLCLKD